MRLFHDLVEVVEFIDDVRIVRVYRRLWGRVAKGTWMLIEQHEMPHSGNAND